MQAVEFEATISDGIIHIPERYRKSLGARVRVILLSEHRQDIGVNLIDQLLENPMVIPEFRPMTRDEIHEP